MAKYCRKSKCVSNAEANRLKGSATRLAAKQNRIDEATDKRAVKVPGAWTS